MTRLGAAELDGLRDDQYAYVDRAGGAYLPIHDEAHIRYAIARWGQTVFESAGARERARRRIVIAARRHGIHVAQEDPLAARIR